MTNYGFSPTVTAAALCLIWAGIAVAQSQTQNGDELSRADMLAKQGVDRCNAGKFAEAERLLREALAIRERLLPSDSIVIGTTLNDLGAALHYQSRFEEAEALYKRSIPLLARRPEEHADCVAAMANLASIYREQKRMEEAAAMYAQILPSLSGPNPVNELAAATVLNDYGMFLKARGNWEGAEKSDGKLPDNSRTQASSQRSGSDSNMGFSGRSVFRAR